PVRIPRLQAAACRSVLGLALVVLGPLAGHRRVVEGPAGGLPCLVRLGRGLTPHTASSPQSHDRVLHARPVQIRCVPLPAARGLPATGFIRATTGAGTTHTRAPGARAATGNERRGDRLQRGGEFGGDDPQDRKSVV